MGEPKIAEIIKYVNKSKWTTQSKLRAVRPNSTEQVKGEKNTNYKMGKHNVNVLEEGKLRMGKSSSSEEVKVEKQQREV